jgi:uncharacterized protein involved in exopolysaccharide biosynthesis
MKRSPSPARIVLLSLAAAALAYVVAMFLPRTYESSASLYFPQSQAGATQTPLGPIGGGGTGDASVSLLGNVLVTPLVGSGQQTALGILNSRTCYQFAAARAGLPSAWRVSQEKAAKRLSELTDARMDKNGFVRLRVQGESPGQCAAAATAMLEHLRLRSEELTLSAAKQNREFLEKRVAEVQDGNADLQARLEVVMRESPFANVEQVQERYLGALDELERATSRQRAAQAQLASIEQTMKAAFDAGTEYPGNITVLSTLSTTLQDQAKALQERRMALEDVMKQFTPESDEYRSARERVETIEEMSARLAREEERLIDRGLNPSQRQTRIEMAVMNESMRGLQRTLDRYERAMASSPKQYAEVTRIRSEFNTALGTLAMLQNQLEMARIAEARSPAIFEVVDAPIPDEDPVAPSKLRIALAVFLLALLVQAAPLVARRLRDQPE